MDAQGSLLADEEVPEKRCWYCGTTSGPWEREHQIPVSRGGGAGTNIVHACARCNHLKGKLTIDEFRDALALRLGLVEVIFWEKRPPHSRPRRSAASGRFGAIER